jgi:Na+-translocating ferredoxin:NAD+ oxidoreductase RNF subunit RnfB
MQRPSVAALTGKTAGQQPEKYQAFTTRPGLTLKFIEKQSCKKCTKCINALNALNAFAYLDHKTGLRQLT